MEHFQIVWQDFVRDVTRHATHVQGLVQLIVIHVQKTLFKTKLLEVVFHYAHKDSILQGENAAIAIQTVELATVQVVQTASTALKAKCYTISLV